MSFFEIEVSPKEGTWKELVKPSFDFTENNKTAIRYSVFDSPVDIFQGSKEELKKYTNDMVNSRQKTVKYFIYDESKDKNTVLGFVDYIIFAMREAQRNSEYDIKVKLGN